MPWVIVLASALAIGAVTMASSYFRGRSWPSWDKLQEKVLPFPLLLLYISTNGVSAGIFTALSCQPFGPDAICLRTDISVQCEGPSNYNIKMLASVLILIWPVGIPLLFGAILFRERRDLRLRRRTSLTIATDFLYSEYRPEWYSMEVWEMLRRLLLSGFVLLIEGAEYVRSVLAILICIAYLLLLLVVRPYTENSNNFLMIAVVISQARTLLPAYLLLTKSSLLKSSH